MSRRSPRSCQHLVELVTDYLDGRLDPRTRRAVEDHFAACRDCSAYLDQMRQLLSISRGLLSSDDASPLPPGMLADLLAEYRRPGQGHAGR